MTIYLLCSTEENVIEVWSDQIIFWDEILLNVFDDRGNPVKQKWVCRECELEQVNDEQLNFLWNCSGTDFMHAYE